MALSLAVQGLTVAAQRIAQGGHFHVAPLAEHAHDTHDDDDDHDHDHLAVGHFHAAIGHHEHAAHESGVVYVDDDHAHSGIEHPTPLKRITLDQELAVFAAPPSPRIEAGMPRDRARLVFRSHVAEPLDPPPRLS
jgi:hypothetical protein